MGAGLEQAEGKLRGYRGLDPVENGHAHREFRTSLN